MPGVVEGNRDGRGLDVGGRVGDGSLDVRDTFGRTQRIAATSTLDGSLGGWRMFGLSGEAGGDPLLLAPVLAAGLHGRDLEEVLLLRDETANLAWAVERQVEGHHGDPVDRAQAAYALRADPPSTAPSPEGTFAYRVATDVPEHWLPLLPVRARPQDPSVRLRLGARNRARPRGRLLRPLAGDAGVTLHEEEVPREGARLTRAYQLARWTDGSTLLWLGRRKGTGRGEGSAGLRYDHMQ